MCGGEVFISDRMYLYIFDLWIFVEQENKKTESVYKTYFFDIGGFIYRGTAFIGGD